MEKNYHAKPITIGSLRKMVQQKKEMTREPLIF